MLLTLLVTSAPVEGAGVPARPALDLEVASLETLREAERTARLWHWSWVGAFGAQVGARVVLSQALEDPAVRDQQWFLAIPPALGTVSQLALPMPGVYDPLPDDAGPEERYRRLRAHADAEARARAWYQHVIGVGINAGAAACLLAEDEPVAAALQFAIGVGLTELRIFTAPRTATEALRGKPKEKRVVWSAAVGPRLVHFSLRF